MRYHLLVGVLSLLFVVGAAAYVAYSPAESNASEPDSSAATYPGAPLVGEPVETASGLTYYDLEVGDGPSPAGPTSQVKVHYTGWLTNGKKFDSSVDRGEPAEFALNRVIKGWTEGVGSMKVGGKRKLIVPPELGYGSQGQRDIPPNSTLVFDVELLGVE